MEIKLVSHASVIIRSDVSIWTDPWLFGKAFNDSWSLFPPAAELDRSALDSIDYIWISHEHPDHFHVPTLRSLPPEFKERITILFQENNSDKVFEALNKFGFPNTMAIPHDKVVKLAGETKVYCYQAGSMDSALGVSYQGETVLNLNDCEVNEKDCNRMKRSLGKIDVVLNQFSIAGYSGFKDRDEYLPKQAKTVLDKVLKNHRDLGADVTIPFASYVFFSTEDNRYINEYANKPWDIYDHFVSNGQRMVVLFPGDSYSLGTEHDSLGSLDRYRAAYSEFDRVEYDKGKVVPLEEIEKSFAKLAESLHEKYPKLVLNRLKPVTVEIPDLDTFVEFSVAKGTFEEIGEGETDLIVRSQPLHFAFSFPYGVQTLGVSARYTLVKGFPNWRRHRILFSLYNAELFLKPRFLFTQKNLSFFRDRLPGAFNQFVYRFKVMR